MLWPWKGSLLKTQTQILDNRLYYTRKIELHRKGKKSCTVRITLIMIRNLCTNNGVHYSKMRKMGVHYSKMSKVPTTVSQAIGEHSP